MGSFDMENDFLFLIILLYWAIINLQEKSSVWNPQIIIIYQS